MVTMLAELLLDVPNAAAATAALPEATILPQAAAVHALIQRRLYLRPLPMHAMLFPDAAGLQTERHGAAVKSSSKSEMREASCISEMPAVVPQDAVQMTGSQLQISTTTSRHAALCDF